MQDDATGYRLVRGAWIHVDAKLPDDPRDVVIEPGAVVGPGVEIGRGNWIGSSAILYGPLKLGEKNQIWPHAVLGGPPQDLSWRGEPTRLEIGDRNIIRESVTMNRASTKGEGVTRVGSDNFFMAYSHVGHDSTVEDHVIVGVGSALGGHCLVESHANISGGDFLHQFVTMGRYAFVCGTCGVRRDLEPYIAFDKKSPGEAGPSCINEVGLKRAGFPPETIAKLRTAYKVLFLKKNQTLDLAVARADIEARGGICAEVEILLDFIERKRNQRLARSRSH